MTSTVTSTPVTVDPVLHSRQGRGEINPYLFQVGTTFYQVLIDDQVGNSITIYLSLDDGRTWTLQDSANSPDQGHQSGYIQAFLQSGVISVLYRTTTPSLKICLFNTSSNTWGLPGTAFTDGTVLSFIYGFRFAYYRKSNGDHVVVGGKASGSYYLTYIAGVWSGPTTLVAFVAGADVWGGVVDPATNIAQVLIQDSDFHLYQISASFVISGPQTLVAGLAISGGRPSITLFGTDSVAVGYCPSTTYTAPAVVYVGSPRSSPTLTAFPILPSDYPFDSESNSYVTVLEDFTQQLNVFFVRYSLSAGNVVQDAVWQASYNGSTFSAPSVFYDALLNPPPDGSPGIEQFIHTFDAIQLSDSAWVIATTMETGPAENFCTGFALISDVCPPETGTPGSLPTYTAPNPPGSCIPWTPTTPRASAVFYDMPLEKQGS